MLGWGTNKTWILKRVRKKGYIILRQLLQESRETIMYVCMYMYAGGVEGSFRGC